MCFTRRKKNLKKIKSSKVYPENNVLQKSIRETEKDKQSTSKDKISGEHH